MKTIIKLIAILIIFMFFGLQNVSAQGSAYVYWPSTTPCPECSIAGDWFWRVDVEVISYCDETPTTVFTGYQIVNSEETDATIQFSEFCDSESQEECYFVVAALKKLCPKSGGGYEVVCQGKFNGENSYYSCPYLMNSSNSVSCPISFE